MNLHLCIPALFWPDDLQADIYRHLELPALETILAKSFRTEGAGRTAESWLCEMFNVAKQHDWPVAPVTLQLDKESAQSGEKKYWLRADPVHLRIENNHLLLGDSHILNISLKEAIAFTDSINELISADGLTLLPLHSDRWYLRCNKTPELRTFLLSEAVGQNINNLLPYGNDSSIWNSRINEIQMLLYDHSLNQEREARGELAINSVWVWGGGIAPQKVYASYAGIWSNHIFVCALAKTGKIPRHALPGNAKELLQYPDSSGEQLVFLDNLQSFASYRDAFHWRNELVKIEQNWFAPLLEALKRRQITRLKLTTIGKHSTRNFMLTPRSLWKFWAAIHPLESYS